VAAGMADRAHPADELDAAVLDGAKRVAKVLLELIVLGKRAAHRAMEAQGIRTGIRATAEIRALGFMKHTRPRTSSPSPRSACRRRSANATRRATTTARRRSPDLTADAPLAMVAGDPAEHRRGSESTRGTM